MGKMRWRWSLTVAWAAALQALLLPCAWSVPSTQQEPSSGQQTSEREIAGMIRELQMDLEGSSSLGVLHQIDGARFKDYPRFRDQVERLTREDTLRVYFRQLSSVVSGAAARTVLDAEMELTRLDSALPTQHRQEKLTIDLEQTSHGWKIVNIVPRDFFEPL
jgi:hypothetical protein